MDQPLEELAEPSEQILDEQASLLQGAEDELLPG
jgi:hypothetical protein